MLKTPKLTEKQRQQISNKISELINSGNYKKIIGRRRDCKNGRCYLGLIQEAIVQLGYGEWMDQGNYHTIKCFNKTPKAIKLLANSEYIYHADSLGLKTTQIYTLNDITNKDFKEIHAFFIQQNNL